MKTSLNKLVIATMLAGLTLVGCSKSIKPENNKPVKLIEIANQQATLTPIFTTKLEHGSRFKKTLKGHDSVSVKDVLDLQIGLGGNMLIAASKDGIVQGFENGVNKWTVTVGEPIVSGVGFDESSNTAIVGTRGGKIIALDGDNGVMRWTQDLKATTLTPAVIAGNRVLISANNGMLYGLNLQSGTIVWQFSTTMPNVSVRGTAKPLRLDADTALFGTADGRIHALISDTGTSLWTRRVGVAIGGSDVGRMSDVDGTPLVAGHYLFVTSFSGNFVGFDMSTGRTLFSQKEFATTKPVALLNQTLIGTDTNGKVYGFNPMTGETLWKSDVLANRKLSAPAVVGGFVAFGDLDGVVHLFNERGDLVGRTATKGKGQIRTLTVNGNRLYAQTTDGTIVAWQVQ